MKNKILYLVIVILLVIIAIAQFVPKNNVLYRLKIDKSETTLNEELSNFSVPDVEIIDKIFIADKENHQVTLDKKSNGWTVNNRFMAREDAIGNLMQAIGKMKVMRPISKAEHNTQIERLAAESRKVEIYSKGKLLKTYYIGGSTQDQYGTYAILENSSVPFVLHIPGFLGFLTPRFIPTEALWRENFIFKAKPYEIDFVQVINYENPNLNYTLKKVNGKYHITYGQNQVLTQIDSTQVKYFLNGLKKISYEAIVVEMTSEKRDSLNKSTPFHHITLKAGKDNVQEIRTYHVPNDKMYDDNGNLLKYDPDRMYAFFNQFKDIATVQFGTFDKITVDPLLFGTTNQR